MWNNRKCVLCCQETTARFIVRRPGRQWRRIGRKDGRKTEWKGKGVRKEGGNPTMKSSTFVRNITQPASFVFICSLYLPPPSSSNVDVRNGCPLGRKYRFCAQYASWDTHNHADTIAVLQFAIFWYPITKPPLSLPLPEAKKPSSRRQVMAKRQM